MRALVFLLVLANLLFFAYSRGYLGSAGSPDAERLQQQLQPERIQVVSKGEPLPAAAPKVEAAGPESGPEAPVVVAAEAPESPAPAASRSEEKKAEAKKSPTCLAWPELSVAEADRLTALVRSKYAASLTLAQSVLASEGGSHWVYIPPLGSKAEAERKAGELRKLGVSEFFIVGEAGANQYAISLGLFSNEQGARDLLESLKSRGVRSARIGNRGGKVSAVRLEARGEGGVLQRFRESSGLAAVSCEARSGARKP